MRHEHAYAHAPHTRARAPPPPGRRDYVKKIAVYKDKLAVQLPNKIVIYELAQGQDDYDMHYQASAAPRSHGARLRAGGPLRVDSTERPGAVRCEPCSS